VSQRRTSDTAPREGLRPARRSGLP
jgi:hypothetical protein